MSLRDMLRLIRSSNNTYLGDWEGVVSESVRQKMKTKIEEQDKRFRTLEVPNQASGHVAEEPSGILPSYLAPQTASVATKTVEILEQTPNKNTCTKSQGHIRVRLNREMYKFNFTGKLYPALETVPQDCRARIISGPEGCPPNIGVHAATGTTFDFHIHAKSYDSGMTLPAGEYAFQYIVQVEDPNARDYEETSSVDQSAPVGPVPAVEESTLNLAQHDAAQDGVSGSVSSPPLS
jgi:hypothetical protein